MTTFLVVYLLVNPLAAFMDGRLPRRVILAGGMVIWSLAASASGLSGGFLSMLVARALLGFGEATFGTLAPAWLSDSYPPERRNRIMTLFGLMTPIGIAASYMLGGVLNSKYGWRSAFFMTGLPGLVCAVLMLFMVEPTPRRPEELPPLRETLTSLKQNKLYLIALAGYIAGCFAAGIMADWFPAYLERFYGKTKKDADIIIGVMVIAGGMIGTIMGGYLADRMVTRTRNPYLAVSAMTMIISAIFAALIFVVKPMYLVYVCMILCQIFLWGHNGPINAVLVNCVARRIRVRSIGISLFALHLLGDAIGPPIVGRISDLKGDLRPGLYLIPVSLCACAMLWAWGWRRLPQNEPGVPNAYDPA